MPDDTKEFEQVLNRLLRSIEELEANLAQKKRFVNSLCAEYGKPPRFPNVEQGRASAISAIRNDQYYGRPQATAVREYLEMRGASDNGGLGAASVNDIYAALVQGGFKFDTKNEANAKRGLRIALAKNVAVFHRVGDAYGLREWYPKIRSSKAVPDEKDARTADEPRAPADEGTQAAAQTKPKRGRPKKAEPETDKKSEAA